jgi:TonB family protein
MTTKNMVIRKSFALTLIAALSVAGPLFAEPDSKNKSDKGSQRERKHDTSGRDADAAARALAAKSISIFTYQPAPTSPIETRGLRGNGLARLSVNQRGAITSVAIMRSTGNRRFDAEAVDTFRRWRARPGSAREVDLPLTAVMSGKRPPVRIPLMQGSMTSG